MDKKLKRSILTVTFALIGSSAFAICAFAYYVMKAFGIVPEATIFYSGNYTVAWGMSVLVMLPLIAVAITCMYYIVRQEENADRPSDMDPKLRKIPKSRTRNRWVKNPRQHPKPENPS